MHLIGTNWFLILVVFLVLMGILYHLVVNNNAQVKPWQTERPTAQNCKTCGGAGVYDITDPTRVLSIEDQMVRANQDVCPCCLGVCVHWVAPGTTWSCKKYVAR